MSETPATFTADELPIGTPLTDPAELSTLGDGSIIALVGDADGFLDTDIYVKFGYWKLEDPEPDGMYGYGDYDDASITVIAGKRDHRQIIVLVRNGILADLPKVDAESIAHARHGDAILTRDELFRNYGGWMEKADDTPALNNKDMLRLAGRHGLWLWRSPDSKTSFNGPVSAGILVL